MTLERSPSHSWWWNSHNSPKHSKWLQSNLQKLDEKVKEMLRLIEEDADSFAKRAEMYYQKRPELVNLVEEFYRAYRSLAERYDYLAGEIRQNIPKALQVQLGLSCDSPKSAGGTVGRQHHYSPLRKADKTFDDLLTKEGQVEDQTKDSHPIDEMQTPERTNKQHYDGIGLVNDALKFCTREDNFSKESSSDVESDNFTPLEKLQQEIENLEMENKLLMDANSKVLQLNRALEKKVEALEDQFRSLESNDGLNLLSHGVSHNTTVVGKEPCFEDVSSFGGSRMDSNAFENFSLRNHGDIVECRNQHHVRDVDGQRTFACTSQRNLSGLIEENEELKQAISERGEEKREAIRQLCLSIDILKHEKQRLLALLASNKRRLHRQQPVWLKILCMGD